MGMVSSLIRRMRGPLLRRLALAWALSFAALLGVGSGVAELFPRLPSAPRAGLFVASMLIAAMYAWFASRPEHISAIDLLPDDLADSPSLFLECVTDRAAVLSVRDMTVAVYPGVQPLPSDRYEQWLMLNPTIFVCLFDSSRNVRGYFDVFPLDQNFMTLFIQGRVGEQDIRREHMLQQRAAKTAEAIYLGGIAVPDCRSHEGRRHAAMLVWGLFRYLEHFYPNPPVRYLYAQAATKEGERLLQKFRFQVVAGPSGRCDPYTLYRALVNEELHDLVRRNVPDFAHMVDLGWDKSKRRLRLHHRRTG
jgi:hypothetical protein